MGEGNGLVWLAFFFPLRNFLGECYWFSLYQSYWLLLWSNNPQLFQLLGGQILLYCIKRLTQLLSFQHHLSLKWWKVVYSINRSETFCNVSDILKQEVKRLSFFSKTEEFPNFFFLLRHFSGNY